MGKGKHNKRKLDTLPEISGTISFVVSLAIDVFFGIVSQQFSMLNIFIFALSIVVLLAGWIWLTIVFCRERKEKRKNYGYKKNQYLDRCCKEDNIDKIEIVRIIAINYEKYTKRCKREKRRYIIMSTMLILGIIVNGCMVVSQYSVMRRIKENDEVSASTNVSSPVNTTTVETTIVNDGDANKGITPEQKEEMENKTFILNDPDRLEVLSDADVERVFYVSTDEDKHKIEVKEHLESVYNQKRRKTIKENSSEERLAAKAQSEEDVFLNKREEAESFRTQENYEGWKNVIPNSNTLESIMGDWEFLLTPLDEDVKGNGVWCIRLANENQLFADEYRLQGGKPQTVVFYQVETIKWTEDGLAYEDLPKGYRSKYTRYLKARYKDIADYIENNLERFGAEKDTYRQIMEKANAIYKAM